MTRRATRGKHAAAGWLVVAALACCCWREGTAEPLRTHLAGRTLERGSSWQQPPRRIPQGALALYGYRRPPRARHPAGSQPLDSGVPGRYEEPARERAWGRDGILRENKRDGYFEALLPPTAAEHHASQLLIHYRDGNPQEWRLLCAWFSGVEGEGTVTLMVSHLGRNGTAWSTPRIAAVQPGRSLQNPVWLWDESADTIYLMYTSQRGKNQGTAAVQVSNSTDGGRRWSLPQVVFATPGAFLKNAPIKGLDGEWLLPMYYTPKGIGNIPSQWSDMRHSQDGGATWSPGIVMAGKGLGLVQPTVVRLADNATGEPTRELVAFFRSRKRDRVWRARSYDEGRTWTQPKRTPLPNPNKSVQAVTLQSGAIALVFNNNRGKGFGKTRGHIYRDSKQYPVSVGLSFDGGRTWPYVRDLQEQFDIRLEFSYPSVVQTSDGSIHITYTWSHTRRRVAVRYMRITEDWIKGRYTFGATRGVYQPAAVVGA